MHSTLCCVPSCFSVTAICSSLQLDSQVFFLVLRFSKFEFDLECTDIFERVLLNSWLFQGRKQRSRTKHTNTLHRLKWSSSFVLSQYHLTDQLQTVHSRISLPSPKNVPSLTTPPPPPIISEVSGWGITLSTFYHRVTGVVVLVPSACHLNVDLNFFP